MTEPMKTPSHAAVTDVPANASLFSEIRRTVAIYAGSRERNRLLEAEAGLRRALEAVAVQRRALPRGGVVPDDYRFEEASDGAEVRFSELFETGKDTLVVYSFMFPRHPRDTRPGPHKGETAIASLRGFGMGTAGLEPATSRV